MSGMDWGGVGSAVIGAGLDYASASAAARQQYKYQKRMYKHRYQWQVQDMKKAGINPMLSATQGAPVPGSVQAPAFEGLGSKAVGAYQQAKVVRAQKDNLEADTDLKGTTSAKNIADARETVVRTAAMEAQLPYSAKNAEVDSLSKDRNFQIMGRQLEKLGYEVGSAKLNLQQQEKIMPLLVRSQDLINQGMAADLVRKNVYSQLWSLVPDKDVLDDIMDLLKDAPNWPSRISEWGKKHGYESR